ncbi:mannose-1-phosphate guanylyltransferase [Siphonobacter sp. SORGH_AS_0500]|uniref:mannose-1-phosphate guanylyltransferase n=1 Tax=Siphonobacter sp. SORGH_AS_0500 TaxID=1864824 RepID=UPI0028611C4A|nr:mannose-1-phosphate guanylyltransferase [Siphonobacter sp. SORGH_AS_0500]MDR6197087.1 mannose-1-phosphate guanylyltransferase [Siphonobacter sp. SORGH_AS_0500]
MNFQHTYVVIMAGGVGTRFWPFSRQSYPKQFHDVLGVGRTMLQMTFDRLAEICPPENVYIVTSQEYYDLTKQQLPQLSDHQILLEPSRRNTAPCIGYACYKIAARDPQANIVVTPADHLILKEQEFVDRIKVALDATENSDLLVTLGITPTRPDTGYGYIQFDDQAEGEVKRVKTFTEKPHLQLAQAFLESGDYVWNAGIFVWNANSIRKAFESYLPEMDEAFRDMATHFYADSEATQLLRAYPQCRNISIDNGVMEKAQNVHVVLSDIGWSDLGTWKSLYEVSEKDENGNVMDGHIVTHNTTGSIIKTPKERLVVVEGLQDFIVAEFDNVLMICPKDQEQKVKEFVADATKRGFEFV